MKKIVIVYCFLSLNFFAQETKVKCIEEESKQFTDEYGDSYSESKSICEYRNIIVQIIERSYMYDCKFSCYDKKYFLIQNNSAVEKSLKDLFSNNSELLKLINSEFKNEFISMSSEDPSCFENLSFETRNWNDLSLSISDSDFIFKSYTGVVGSCEGPFGELTFYISIKEIEKFILK